MQNFIIKYRLIIAAGIGILAGLFILTIGSDERDFSRYGLHDYKAGLQKAFNICKADPNVTVVCYYKFDDTSGLKDYSSNEKNLIASGTPSYQQVDYISLNRAVNIKTSTSDYFYYNQDTLFDLGTNYDFCIWVILKVPAGSTNRRIFAKYQNTTGRYDLFFTNDRRLRIYLAWNQPSSGNLSIVANTSNMDDGTWRMITVLGDRSSTTGLDILMNGISDVTTKGDMTTVGNLDSNSQFFIGCGITAGADILDGTPAEFFMIKGDPLPDYIFNADFQKKIYQWAMEYPLSIPREIE